MSSGSSLVITALQTADIVISVHHFSCLSVVPETSLCKSSVVLQSLGLKIKEMDAASTNPTVTERLDLDCCGMRLENMMDDFSRKVTQYITDKVVVQEVSSNKEWQEEHMLPLPSNIGPTQCQDTDLGYLLEQELELR
ncbi:hypothetical protein BS17DRAFT_763041 [Gyrodon lividus]|nr:hypothetical protein BS17DRAFT_763041 [Gyrodon lividus]